MKCNHACIATSRVAPIDETTTEILCPIHGTTYLFRSDDGGWETADARKKRMATYRVCEGEECGAEYQIKDHPVVHSDNVKYRLLRRFCPACVEALLAYRGLVAHAPSPDTRTKHDTTWARYGIAHR